MLRIIMTFAEQRLGSLITVTPIGMLCSTVNRVLEICSKFLLWQRFPPLRTVVAEDAKPGQGGKERNKGSMATCRYDRSNNSLDRKQNNCSAHERIGCPSFVGKKMSAVALDGERTEVGGSD